MAVILLRFTCIITVALLCACAGGTNSSPQGNTAPNGDVTLADSTCSQVHGSLADSEALVHRKWRHVLRSETQLAAAYVDCAEQSRHLAADKEAGWLASDHDWLEAARGHAIAAQAAYHLQDVQLARLQLVLAQSEIGNISSERRRSDAQVHTVETTIRIGLRKLAKHQDPHII